MNAVKAGIRSFAMQVTPQRYFTGLFLMMFALMPQAAEAQWYDPILTFARDFKTGLIIVCGLIALSSVVYCGASWMVSRMVGSMETQFFDYVKTVGIVGVVGGSVAAATWAYSIWGGQISS